MHFSQLSNNQASQTAVQNGQLPVQTLFAAVSADRGQDSGVACFVRSRPSLMRSSWTGAARWPFAVVGTDSREGDVDRDEAPALPFFEIVIGDAIRPSGVALALSALSTLVRSLRLSWLTGAAHR